MPARRPGDTDTLCAPTPSAAPVIQLSWPCLNQPSPSGEPDARVREHRRFASAIIFCEYSFRCTCVQVISLVAGTQNVQQPPLGAGVVARRCSNLFYMAGLLRGDTATPPEWRGCCPEVQQPLLSGRSCREGAAAVPVAKVQQPPLGAGVAAWRCSNLP